MGQTRVDLQHLLEDLRDAYPGPLEETILTEIVANALDSGASRLALRTDRTEGLLVLVDDGAGMTRRELARYHDVAASTKVRGHGIGFAGVGIKLGLLAADEVITETVRGEGRAATRWRLASRHKAPWSWIEPPGLVAGHGTAVGLKLSNVLSPLLDASWLEATVRRHFQPLFDPGFDEVLSPYYARGLEVSVDGRLLARERIGLGEDAAWLTIRLPRKRRPAAVGYLRRAAAPLPEEERGLAVSTLGKVIRRGWDWLGLAPSAPDLVGGLVEAPGLAESLVLNKGDFVRSGARGLTYLAYRKAVQQAVSAQLAAWGEGRDVDEAARRRAARPVERDLESVLVDLADEFPALSALVERRPGGQRRLPGPGSPLLVEPSSAPAGPRAEQASALPAPTRSEATIEPAAAARGPRRPTRYGLRIEFEERDDAPEDMGRLVDSTVFVNTAHPAYRRAAASRAEGYHVALTAAMALAPLAAEPAGAQAFLATFLAAWGEALARDQRRRQSRWGRRRRSPAGPS